MRTLDALHLASYDFLPSQVHGLQLASYDDPMLAAGPPDAIPVVDLG